MPSYRLAHPIYLDLPMMLSFLAHIEGGVSFSESETTTDTGVRDRVLKARAGLRAKLWTVGEAGLDGESTSQKREETASESRTERHHTGASLFNVLYYYLREDSLVVDLDSPGQLDSLVSGDLVEVHGDYLGNPIENVLAFFNTVLPYVTDGQPPAAPTHLETASGHRSGNPAKRASTAGGVRPQVQGGNAD